MSEWLLFDPMFRVPFLTGLALALALSLVGAWLRMRNEWLAALGLSQIAAAGAMAAVWLHGPALLGAFIAAAIAMLARTTLPRIGNNHYALMILIGWSATLMIGSMMDHGNVAGETFLRGQLYFASTQHLVTALILLTVVAVTYRWLSPRLLTARFFPDYHQANRIPVWPYRTCFALIVITAVVIGTTTMGAFPAFAMLFVPSWVGFVIVDGWQRSVIASMLVGTAAYLIAFVVAMLLDQPFGPMLTIVLVLAGTLRFFTARRRRIKTIAVDDLHPY